MDNARELKFSSYVYLASINKMFQYCYVQVILWIRGGYYFQAWVLYFSFGTYYDVNILKAVIFFKHVLTQFINGHAWVISEDVY